MKAVLSVRAAKSLTAVTINDGLKAAQY